MVEFTGLLAFFNIAYDRMIDQILVFVANIGDLNLLEFPIH